MYASCQVVTSFVLIDESSIRFFMSWKIIVLIPFHVKSISLIFLYARSITIYNVKCLKVMNSRNRVKWEGSSWISREKASWKKDFFILLYAIWFIQYSCGSWCQPIIFIYNFHDKNVHKLRDRLCHLYPSEKNHSLSIFKV